MIFKIVFITLFGIKIVVKSFIDFLNYDFLRKNRDIPEEFKGVVDENKIRKIGDYNAVKVKFNLSREIIETAIIMIFLFTPLFKIYFNWIDSLGVIYIVKGVLFFWITLIVDMILMLPMDYYFNFGIEQKYEFNGYSLGGWIIDQIKGLLLGMVIYGIVLIPILKFVNNDFQFSWPFVLWGTLFASSLAFIFMYLVPVLLMPIFYKLKPIEDENLKGKIVELVEKAGFKVRGVYVADESKKSKHANAMFSGFGNSRSVILFDNLLNGNYSDDEILAVLGHEIGHGVHKHILKFYLLVVVEIFLFFLTVAWLLSTQSIYTSMGIDKNFYAGLFLLMILFFYVVGYFVQPFNSALSRRYEYQADAYSKKLLGSGEGLISAFKKFVVNELSVIEPHPIYEWFYYTHPSLIKRIRRLKESN
ncbi:MAG: M48 family metalloprotease [Proteobacteria bacterium]|nr:M48 family metalloprotease [Pseudomonadota bacterium]